MSKPNTTPWVCNCKTRDDKGILRTPGEKDQAVKQCHYCGKVFILPIVEIT